MTRVTLTSVTVILPQHLINSCRGELQDGVTSGAKLFSFIITQSMLSCTSHSLQSPICISSSNKLCRSMDLSTGLHQRAPPSKGRAFSHQQLPEPRLFFRNKQLLAEKMQCIGFLFFCMLMSITDARSVLEGDGNANILFFLMYREQFKESFVTP